MIRAIETSDIIGKELNLKKNNVIFILKKKNILIRKYLFLFLTLG